MAIFGLELNDFIAILAVCVAVVSSALAAVTFLITYSRNRKSEQIKIAREIYDEIDVSAEEFDKFQFENTYPDEGSIEDKRKWVDDTVYLLEELLDPIHYFTYLVKQKEMMKQNKQQTLIIRYTNTIPIGEMH